jgi:hypothetical protein
MADVTNFCTCDSAYCTRSLWCKTLGEYRITWAVLIRLQELEDHEPIRTVQDALFYIETECEILVK